MCSIRCVVYDGYYKDIPRHISLGSIDFNGRNYLSPLGHWQLSAPAALGVQAAMAHLHDQNLGEAGCENRGNVD